jgi:hypothetical protein
VRRGGLVAVDRWSVVDKDLEPCEENYYGRIASGFMTEAEALDYIARYGSHKRLIEMERIKMKYGLDTGEG